MQQQGGGGGGGGGAQQFGVQPPPEMPSFSPDGGAGQRISLAEAPSPISSRPPAQQFDDLGAGAAAGDFDAEALAAAAVGEEGASGGSASNRWPRQETLALLKIRLDMDAAFRDATLKGPLWEDVSRKLAEEGYRRSAKKCKEKFENVHKYYKRTKDSRAGRTDGKTYRFFRQLEALHGTGAASAAPVASLPPPATAAVGVSGMAGPSAVRAPAEPPPVGPTAVAGATSAGMPPVVGNMSFSTSNTEEYSDEEDSDDEDTEEMGGPDERGKRKRLPEGGAAAAGGGVGSGKMMRFFERLMKQVMERQEAMQQRFLEAIEKREQDRMIREEAWRRQEMARLAREQEILAKDRAMAASRDAAVVSFIQKITGQTIQMPSIAAPAITVMPPPSQLHPTPIASAAPAPPTSSQLPASHSQPPPQPQPSLQPQQKSPMPATPQLPQAPTQQQQQLQSSMDIVMTPVAAEPHDAAGGSGYDGSGGGGPSPSRWPKAEVHALIQLRSNMDTRYQETGPKGPLWEEISVGMRRLGYNRSSKRCKEKWENINKYFKKVKESNKKRPEDSKTCPYFHQLDALYRNKAALNSDSSGGGANLPAAEHANAAPQERSEAVTVAVPISQTTPQPLQHVAKNSGTSNNAGNGNRGRNGGGPSDGGGSCGGMQMKASNGSVAAGRLGGDGSSMAAKKPEDIMKEMMEQRLPQPQLQQQAAINSYNRIDGGADSHNMDEDEDDDYDDDDDDDGDDDDDVDGNKMQYEIQFQRQQQQQQHHNVVRPNAAASSGGGNPPGTAAPGTAAAATKTAGSFLAMVQ